MLPLGSLGGFHLRMIWEEELDEEMGSSGTEGSGETSQKGLTSSNVFLSCQKDSYSCFTK